MVRTMGVFIRRMSRYKALLAMAVPGLFIVFVFSYLPMVGIVIAFEKFSFEKGLFGSPWVGFENFYYLFATADAWRITYNTLFLNALFIVCTLIVSLIFALLFNEVRSRWALRFYQSVIFYPFFISWVIVGYFVFGLLSNEKGVVNSWLVQWGLSPVSWYTSPEYWPAILVIVYIWKNTGYFSVIYLAGMLGINSEYYEASKIDGANRLQQVYYITLPLIMPLIVIMTLLQIGRIFYADFGLFYNVTRDSGLLYSTTDVIDTYVYRSLRVVGDLGMASAAGFYQAVVSFVLVVTANWLVRVYDKDKALF